MRISGFVEQFRELFTKQVLLLLFFHRLLRGGAAAAAAANPSFVLVLPVNSGINIWWRPLPTTFSSCCSCCIDP
ncbi:hypothetical protein HanIR_Chr13g0637371 [Helianthus annuus]|nr:hypothetical protein HanIR_Chr13g0637371 [Helianthus annuus]